jgi:hypothetical protein
VKGQGDFCTRQKSGIGRERPHFCGLSAAQKVPGVAPAHHASCATLSCRVQWWNHTVCSADRNA